MAAPATVAGQELGSIVNQDVT
jgi:hypothetical protein